MLAHGLPLKICRLAATTRPVRRHVDGAHRTEHVRAIVWQPAVRVGEIVGIAPERQVGERHGAALRARCRRPAGGLQPGVSRQRVRAKRLPAAGVAFFHGQDEAVVRHRVAVGIRQQKPSSGRAVDEREHGYGGAVGQRWTRLTILTADVRPADEIGAVLADVGDRHRQPATDFAIHANGVLVGVRCAYSWIEQQVLLGINDRDEARVAAGLTDRTLWS